DLSSVGCFVSNSQRAHRGSFGPQWCGEKHAFKISPSIDQAFFWENLYLWHCCLCPAARDGGLGFSDYGFGSCSHGEVWEARSFRKAEKSRLRSRFQSP